MKHWVITYILLFVALAFGLRALALMGGFPWNYREPPVAGPGRIMGVVAIVLGTIAIGYGIGGS